MATVSPSHREEASSRRSTSATFVLTTIFEEKSSPTPRSRYVWNARAKQ
jgi:hypothetical protein